MSSRIKLRKQKWARPKNAAPSTDLLTSALRKHQEGHIEEATKIYQAILSSSPSHVDALHFLGVAEHQLGQSERALETGFDAPSIREARLRKEADKWVEGWLVSARVPDSALHGSTP